jgi:hypothetical protein
MRNDSRLEKRILNKVSPPNPNFMVVAIGRRLLSPEPAPPELLRGGATGKPIFGGVPRINRIEFLRPFLGQS